MMIKKELKQKKTLSIVKQMFVALSLLMIVITAVSANDSTDVLMCETSVSDALNTHPLVADDTSQTHLHDKIDSFLESDNKPVFIYFYSKLCSFCEKQKPIIEELREECSDNISFIFVNVENPSFDLSGFDISGYPTMMVIYDSGKNLDRQYVNTQTFIGTADKKKICCAIESSLNGGAADYLPQPFIPEPVFIGRINKSDFSKYNAISSNWTVLADDVPQYCADFCLYDNPDFNYWLDTICNNPYCANDWRVHDINGDGYSEHYLLVGDTYYQWGYAKAQTGVEQCYVYDFGHYNFDEHSHGCTESGADGGAVHKDYCGDAREYTYLSKPLTGTANRLSSFEIFAWIFLPDSNYYMGWGWYSWDLYWTLGGHTEYAMVLECGVDADCPGGQVCCKPTLSDPTSYYCAAQLSTPTLSALSDACADTSYTVSWNSVSGATSYKLYENGNNMYDGSELSRQFSHPSGSYTYYVQACNDCGCSGNSNSETVSIKQKPDVCFTTNPDPPEGCVPLTVEFDASCSSGEITSYSWDFGDDETGTGETFLHQYDEVDNYTVTLTVSGPCGSDTATKVVYVEDCEPFTNITVGSATEVVGSTTTLDVMINNVTNAGAVDLNLTYNPDVVQVTTASNGDFDVTTKNLAHSIDGYIRIIAYQTGEVGLNGNILVTILTLEARGVGTSVLDLSDTKLSDNTPQQNNIYVELVNGTFVTIQGAPSIISFAPSSPVNDTDGATRMFNITVDQIVNVSWRINGTEVQINESVTEAFYMNKSAAVGTWNVSAIVTNANGADMQVWVWNVTLRENQPPIASFTYTPGNPIVNQTITFNASSSYDPDGNITDYEWDFGDGNTTNTTEEMILHSYALAGNYNVSLTVTDNDGATNTSVLGIAVSSMPDLVVTENWICWPDNCTICYNLTNIGNGPAPAGHNTTLFVDGIETASDHVAVALEPNESYTGCFDDYNWTYTPPEDNVTVCADSNNTVAESNETNNCMFNTWKCGDVDGNGIVNVMDVRLLMNHVADPTGYPVESWTGDVDGDSDIDGEDVQLLLAHVFAPEAHPLNCRGD